MKDLIASVDKLIWNLVRKQAGTIDIFDPEDLYQELVLHLTRVVHTYSEDKGAQFSTWAYHVLLRKLINLTAKAKRREAFKADTQGEVDFLQAVPYAESLDLEAAHLSTRQARVIRGVFEDGKTHQELAKELGVSSSAVGITYRQALGRIRATYERQDLSDGEARAELHAIGRVRHPLQYAPSLQGSSVW